MCIGYLLVDYYCSVLVYMVILRLKCFRCMRVNSTATSQGRNWLGESEGSDPAPSHHKSDL